MLRFVVSGHMRRLLRARAVEVIEAGTRPLPRYRLSPDDSAPNRPANIEAGSRPT